MSESTRRAPVWLAPALFVLGIAGAVGFTLSFPAVEGLGDKVRLPVFHGALTWVNLMLFGLLAVFAGLYLARRTDSLYRWMEAIRWTAIPLWVAGSVLGLLAALRIWDFTGSKSSPIQVAMEDPRLVAQFWIMLAALALLALGLLVDERHWLAIGDIAFTGITAAVLGRAVLGPGRALHPDSPVLNSEEIGIKLIFLGIVASLMLSAMCVAWMIARRREAAEGRGAAANVA